MVHVIRPAYSPAIYAAGLGGPLRTRMRLCGFAALHGAEPRRCALVRGLKLCGADSGALRRAHVVNLMPRLRVEALRCWRGGPLPGTCTQFVTSSEVGALRCSPRTCALAGIYIWEQACFQPSQSIPHRTQPSPTVTASRPLISHSTYTKPPTPATLKPLKPTTPIP